MELRDLYRRTGIAVVTGAAAVAWIACGGAVTSELPTSGVTTSPGGDTVTASDLTSADNGGSATDGRPQGPPEEALAACAGRVAETPCSFTSPRDGSTLDGTCRTRRDDASQLVCVPDDWHGGGGPRSGHPGPPEEAVRACEGIATGSTCSFEAPFGRVEGTCDEGPDGSGQVACRPDGVDAEGPIWGGGPGHGRPAPEEARAACDGLQEDASCSFKAPFGTVEGTCRLGRDGATLVCVPTDGPPQ